jgi:3-oxoacyl-[acyl-carrier-protein] synthase-1
MSEEPLRGEGLARAFRQALAGAGLEMARVGYRIGTMSGEQYWFKEFELATSRLLRGRHEFMDLWHPADCIGEVGAASLPCCIAVAAMAVRKGYAAGDPVLVTASNDDSRRAALVLTGQR